MWASFQTWIQAKNPRVLALLLAPFKISLLIPPGAGPVNTEMSSAFSGDFLCFRVKLV